MSSETLSEADTLDLSHMKGVHCNLEAKTKRRHSLCVSFSARSIIPCDLPEFRLRFDSVSPLTSVDAILNEDTILRQKTVLKGRRHSISMGAEMPPSHCESTQDSPKMSALDCLREKCNLETPRHEHSAMIAEWVDDCNADLQDLLMVLAGDDFKQVALKPHDSHRDNAGEHFVDSETCSTRARDESIWLIDDSSNHLSMHKPSVRAAIESLEPKCTSYDAESTSRRSSFQSHTQSRRGSIQSGGSSRRILIDDTPWPTFSGGAEAHLRARAALSTSTLNALEYSPDDLAILVADVFQELGLEELGMAEDAVRGFVLSVRARMLDNPYHNWTHAADVTQTAYFLAKASGVLARLGLLQRLALFLAALCHDLEHPGVTTAYLVKSKSNLAACYKADPGLLEKHHSLRAFELMTCAEISLLAALPPADRQLVTSLVRDLIMATDMTQHPRYLDAVAARAATEAPESGAGPHTHPVASSATAGARAGAEGIWSADLVDVQVLLKCADVSNVVKPFAAAREWAVCVTDEFFAQGELERARGLPVTPMCDRESQTRVGLQLGFIDHVAGPFFRAVVRIFPGLAPLLDQLEANRQAWCTYDDDTLLRVVVEDRRRRGCAGSSSRVNPTASPQACAGGECEEAVKAAAAADAAAGTAAAEASAESSWGMLGARWHARNPVPKGGD